MKRFDPMVNLYIMQALSKGFQVLYFVLLPVFYAEKIITASQLGYIGGLFIILLIVGAMIVAQIFHTLETKKLLQLSSGIIIVSSCALLTAAIQHNVLLLTVSYAITGLMVGVAMAGVKALSARMTVQGDRYKTLAKLHMSTDIIRIVFPLFVSGTVLLGASILAIMLIIVTTWIFYFFITTLPNDLGHTTDMLQIEESVVKNHTFLYALSLEFLDSFASSQLFVFLPLLFLAKGYSLGSSITLQSFVFLGYLCGRWFVSLFAKKYSGSTAVSLAEIGMVIAIIVILSVKNLWLLYLLSFVLGIFARGTSPAIEALSFDTLTATQVKKGTALHVVAGDSGSALGQLLFGLLIAWYGTTAPFFVSAAVAGCVGIVAFFKPITIYKIEE